MIGEYHSARLSDLVRFRLMPARLQIQYLLNAIAGKNVVVAANPLLKSQLAQVAAKIAKFDVSIRAAAQNSFERFRRRAHVCKYNPRKACRQRRGGDTYAVCTPYCRKIIFATSTSLSEPPSKMPGSEERSTPF